MLINKKIALYLLIWCFFGFSLFPLFVQAKGLPPFPVTMERVGDDNQLTDQSNDLYREVEDKFTSVSVQIPWIDLKNISFDENGSNYTVTVGLNGNFNVSASMSIYIYLDINSSGLEAKDSYLYLYVSPSSSKVICEGISTYEQYDIHTINGEIITWTFPKLNVTDIIPNSNLIPEWKVLVLSWGDFLSTAYYDFVGVSAGNISAYPLIFFGLISVATLFILLKKVRNSY